MGLCNVEIFRTIYAGGREEDVPAGAEPASFCLS